MLILKGLLNLRGVYWPPGESNKFGEVQPLAPIEIACKWTNRRVQHTDNQGNKYTTTGEILTQYPIEVGGHVFRGTLDQAPLEPPNNMRVRSVSRTDAVSNDETLYTGGY